MRASMRAGRRGCCWGRLQAASSSLLGRTVPGMCWQAPRLVGPWRRAAAAQDSSGLAADAAHAVQVLELQKLAGPNRQITCSSSIDRQCHTYALTERLNKRSLPLKRIFTRRGPGSGGSPWRCADGAGYGNLPLLQTVPCCSRQQLQASCLCGRARTCESAAAGTGAAVLAVRDPIQGVTCSQLWGWPISKVSAAA